MEPIEVIPMIRREIKRNHFSLVDVARKLRVEPSSVKGMLSRPTLQVQRLADLSEACNFNFFREIAGMLPYADPMDIEKITAGKEKEVLTDRIKALEMEVAILRQTIKDMASR